MNRRLVLVGGGGHARSLLAVLGDEVQVAGYADMHPCDGLDIPYLGTDTDCISLLDPAEYEVAVTLVSGPDCSMALRRKIIESYHGFSMPMIIAPTAMVAGCRIGPGVQLMHRTMVNAGADIGSYSIVNTGAIVEHDCRIGSNVFIGPGAVICGGVEIGDDCYIGANVTVRPGVRICAGAVIGLAAAVTKDITEPRTYVGIPARPL